MTTAATIDVELRAEVAKLSEGLKKANKDISSLKDSADLVGKAFGNLKTITLGALSGAAIGRFALDAIRAADAVGDAADRAGVAASTLSRLSIAAKQSDVEFDSLTNSIKIFQNNISDAAHGSASAIRAFQAIGVNVAEIRNLKPEAQLGAIADAFAKIKDPADRVSAAMNLFGKTGSELIPFLLQGSSKIDELANSAIALDDRAVKALDRSSKALDRLTTSLKNFFANTAGDLVAKFAGSGDEVLDAMAKLDELTGERLRAVARGFPTDEIDRRIAKQEQTVERLKKIEEAQQKAANPKFSSNHTRLAPVDPLSPIEVTLQKRGDPVRDALSNPFAEIEEERRAERIKKIDQELRETQKQQERELTEWMQQENERRIAGIVDLADHTINIQNDMNDILNRISLGRANFEINLDDLVGQTKLQTAANFVGALLAFNKKHAKAEKALALAQTVWETGRAIMKAAPNPALMAAAAAAGAINLAKINATNYSESGSSGAGIGFTSSDFSQSSSTTGGQQTDQSSNQRGTINVYLEGMVGTQEFVPYFVEKLKDLIDNRDVHIISGNSSQARALRVAA